jgi:hypothetical protein
MISKIHDMLYSKQVLLFSIFLMSAQIELEKTCRQLTICDEIMIISAFCRPQSETM